jgi:hypothetical protein
LIVEFHDLRAAQLKGRVAKEIDLPAIAGANRLRLNPGRLRPGRYGLLVRATSAGGQTAARQRVDVSIRR